MTDKVLMSLGKICDNSIEAHLTKEKIIITQEDNKKEIMREIRYRTNRMWYLNLNDSTISVKNIKNKQLINSVCELRK